MQYWYAIFLVVTFPFCIYATWSDLKFLKIPNILPLSMVAVFILLGPIVLPFDEYLRSLLYGFIALLLGIAIFAARLVPAGDLKFTAAIIPFVDTNELLSFAMFVSLAAFLAVFTHLVFGWLGLAPRGWASWKKGGGWKRHFPVGFALAGGLLIYLAAHFFQSA